MNFDPVNFMNSADAANIQVISQVDESKFKDYTDKVLFDMSVHHYQNLQNPKFKKYLKLNQHLIKII